MVAVPIGSEFQVNTFTTDNQDDAEVAFDANGNFIIVWETYELDGDGAGIYAQRYNADGTLNGSNFQVNTTTTDDQFDGRVAFDGNGNFVITWEDRSGQDGVDAGIFAQRYNADGTPNGSEFQVNTFTNSNQATPEIAVDGNGNFVIAWESYGQDGDGYGVYAQRYNADGTPNGSEFQVNTTTTGAQDDVAIAFDGDGNFILTWESYGQDGDFDGVYAQRYNADGTLNGSEFQVNTFTTDNQDDPEVAFDGAGNFVITWESYGQEGGDNGVYAQRYNADGTADGSEFQVNTFTTDSQDDPAVAVDSDGNFIIAWESYGQDGDNNGVYAQRYVLSPLVKEQSATIFVDIDSTNIVVGNAFQVGLTYTGDLFSNTDLAFNIDNDPDDVILGTDGADNIWGGTDGSDIIDSGAGNDIIGFGDGDACVHAGEGDDFVYAAGAGAGTNDIDLDAGNDTFFAITGNHDITGTGNNTIGVGTGNDTVTTGDGDDFVYTVESGGGGTNVLDLGNGTNTVFVETGDYTITTGAGADIIGLGDGSETVNAGNGNNIVYRIDASGTSDGVKDIVTGSGDDFVQTGSGNDLIDAGAGTNSLVGGTGSDTFTFRTGAYNFISDFEVGTDLIELDGLIFENLTFFQGTGDVAADTFLFVGNESIGQVADTAVAALNDISNFV